MDPTETLEVDALAVGTQPVDHLVEQARVVAAEACGREQERLRINEAVVVNATLPGDSQRGPLVPQEIEEALEKPILGILESGLHVREG